MEVAANTVWTKLVAVSAPSHWPPVNRGLNTKNPINASTNHTKINTPSKINHTLAHVCWTLLNCSTLSQCLFRQAHSFPFIPSTMVMTKPTTGMRETSAIHVLFPMPHIQLKPKAPQLQPFTSMGTTAAAPCPEVFRTGGYGTVLSGVVSIIRNKSFTDVGSVALLHNRKQSRSARCGHGRIFSCTTTSSRSATSRPMRLSN